MENDEPGDLDIEANCYDEFAGALEACARGYRRAAALLRGAGRHLAPADLDAIRIELAGVTRRTIAASTIAAVLTGRPGGSVEP